jgi:peptidoglycan/LPS O-acetylase OafA/YrhL
MIYFAIGAVCGRQAFFSGLSQLNPRQLVAVTIGGLLSVTVSVWLGLIHYQLVVPIVAMLGVSASLALAMLLERLNVVGFIQVWGLLSLQIYVVHTIATSGVRIVLQKLFGFTEPFTHILLGTIAGMYAPILDRLCQQLRFRYLFTLRPQRS